MNSNEMDFKIPIYLIIGSGIALYILMIVLAKLYTIILKLKESDRPIHENGLIFGNTIFLGYPIVKALLGESAIFVNTMVNLPFNILFFSYGLYLFTKDEKGIKFNKKSLINPAFIASILALIIYSFKINFPYIIKEIVYSVGGLTVPLSMLIIGSSLATVKFMDLFEDYRVLILSFVKLVIFPIIFFVLAKLFNLPPLLIKIITISAGYPLASMIVMFATYYDRNIKAASVSVFLTTILSFVTIPLIVRFLFPLI